MAEITEEEESALSLNNAILAIERDVIEARVKFRALVGDGCLEELSGEERIRAENAHGVYTGLLSALLTARRYRLQ